MMHLKPERCIIKQQSQLDMCKFSLLSAASFKSEWFIYVPLDSGIEEDILAYFKTDQINFVQQIPPMC